MRIYVDVLMYYIDIYCILNNAECKKDNNIYIAQSVALTNVIYKICKQVQYDRTS